MPKQRCMVETCSASPVARDLCPRHYQQLRREQIDPSGAPLETVRELINAEERVSFRVPKMLAKEMEYDAKRRKLTVSEIWRLAASSWLD